MMLKRIWNDPVGSKVISWAICLALAAMAVYASVHWWGPLSTAIAQTWRYIVADSVVPRWLLGFLLFWLVGTVILGAVVLVSVLKKPEPLTSLSYKEDEFFKLRWRWSYNSMGSVRNLGSFCRACDYQIHPVAEGFYYGNHSAQYVCKLCPETSLSFEESSDEIEDDVIKRIQREIRSGGWEQAIRKS